MARATGIAGSTIGRGLKELAALNRAGSKVRRSGGGRPALRRADPTLLEDLRGLLESTTLGDPTRPLIWVSKSHAKLALALEGLGHRVSATRIPQLLERLGYRRQVNRKSLEGGHHVDRNAQFEYINAQVEAFQAAGQPVISVDGSRVRLWKVELQKFADETGLPVSVSHYPPGTSKWNKIEHRLFCHITQNWRGRRLTSRSAVVELIAATTTKKGLTVRCELDANTYEKGVKVSDAEMAALNIEGDAFHPEWNYTIKPRPREAPS